MGVPRPHKLADGLVHFAKISYYRFLKVGTACVLHGAVTSDSMPVDARLTPTPPCVPMPQFDLLPFFTGSSSLLQFLKDNGEVRDFLSPLRPPVCGGVIC